MGSASRVLPSMLPVSQANTAMDLTGVKFILYIIIKNIPFLDHSPAYSSGKFSVIHLTFHECLCQNGRQTSFGFYRVHELDWEMGEISGHSRGVHREGTRGTEVKKDTPW